MSNKQFLKIKDTQDITLNILVLLFISQRNKLGRGNMMGKEHWTMEIKSCGSSDHFFSLCL